jgi:hypothetical protein
MNSTAPHTTNKSNLQIKSEHLNQVISAIIDGKYSWACVLLLRIEGYNPLQYIPYRTYNRLLKENTLMSRSSNNCVQLHHHSEIKTTTQISDLNYLEPVNSQEQKVSGGNRFIGFWQNIHF